MAEQIGGLLDGYFAAQLAVHEAFGYKEDWCVFPLVDERDVWWRIVGLDARSGTYGAGAVQFWRDEENIGEWLDNDGYEHAILPNRFLPKSIYEGDGFTMVLVDTMTDGNRYLAIFDNAKKRA